MDIKLFKQKIQSIRQILEDATCADLAPYPVLPVGKIVTITSKKKKQTDEPKEESSN